MSNRRAYIRLPKEIVRKSVLGAVLDRYDKVEINHQTNKGIEDRDKIKIIPFKYISYEGYKSMLGACNKHIEKDSVLAGMYSQKHSNTISYKTIGKLIAIEKRCGINLSIPKEAVNAHNEAMGIFKVCAPKIGTRIHIIKASSGCFGANGCKGVVISPKETLASQGLLREDKSTGGIEAFMFKSDDGTVWRVACEEFEEIVFVSDDGRYMKDGDSFYIIQNNVFSHWGGDCTNTKFKATEGRTPYIKPLEIFRFSTLDAAYTHIGEQL